MNRDPAGPQEDTYSMYLDAYMRGWFSLVMRQQNESVSTAIISAPFLAPLACHRL
jgi:hypothetical protein